jgi:cell division protein FtsL
MTSRVRANAVNAEIEKMTRREKVMATTLIVVMAVVGGGLLFHLFIYQPINEVRTELADENDKLKKAQDSLTALQTQIKTILTGDPRLSQWQKISLPPRNPEAKKATVSSEEQQMRHISQLQVAYELFLHEMLRKNGFAAETIVVTPRTTDRRANPILRGKEEVYQKMAFGVTGRGSLEAVLRCLKEFHQANLLHQIRNFTLAVSQARGRVTPTAGALDMSMTIEALLVKGAEERKSLLPEKLSFPPRVTAEPARKYSSMLYHNIFTGSTTGGTGSPDDPEVVAELKKKTENRKDVLSFVKLTMLCYDTKRGRWAATLYDQGKGGDEIQIEQRLGTDLVIYDDGKNTMLEAKVVFIDAKQIIFKADGKYYRMCCGDFVYPCLDKSLTSTELKELGISP